MKVPTKHKKEQWRRCSVRVLEIAGLSLVSTMLAINVLFAYYTVTTPEVSRKTSLLVAPSKALRSVPPVPVPVSSIVKILSKKHHPPKHVQRERPKPLQCSDLDDMPPVPSRLVSNQCVWGHYFFERVHVKRDVVSEAIDQQGCWERNIMNSIVEHFGVEANPARTFIDIGGNIGAYTTTLAQLGHHVIAVEPFQLNVPLILQTLCHQKAMDRVQLFKVALSDKSPGQKMCLWSTDTETNNGNARMVPYFNGTQTFGQDRDKACMEVIYTYTLDELLGLELEQQQPLLTSRPWGMKMDIEGYETLALRGAERLLTGPYAPCRIWFEYQSAVTVQSGAGAFELFDLQLYRARYTKLYFMETMGWKPVPQHRLGVSYRDGDYMAIHADPECQGRDPTTG